MVGGDARRRPAGGAVRVRARQIAARPRRARLLHRSAGLRARLPCRDERDLPGRGRAHGVHAAGDRGEARPVVCRRTDRRAADRARQRLDAALRRPFGGVRLGLDACAWRTPPPCVRSRVCAVGPCRLGRSPLDDPGHGRGTGVRDAWLYRAIGPVSRVTGNRCRTVAHAVRGRAGVGMKRFARLYDEIDRTTSTNAKVNAIAAYLAEAPPADAAWALFFLTGRRLKRHLPTRLMHAWTQELTDLPEWLVHESYGVVGDFAETIALLLDGRVEPNSLERLHPPGPRVDGRLPFDDVPSREVDVQVEDVTLATWIEQRIIPLRQMDDGEKRMHVIVWWSRLPRHEVFLLNKLLTGEFRVGVSHTLVVRAIAHRSGLPTAAIEHRLMGSWEPSAEAFATLIAPDDPSGDPSRPYPFCLASPLADPVETLGARDEWLVEWKWDGIRAQLIHRAGQVFLWSRGEQLITTRFPEIAAVARALPPGTVLDGEVLAFEGGAPRPFADLQRRIGRERRVQEVAVDVPVVFLAYDVLEDRGVDIRDLPLRERRRRLLALEAGLPAGPI